MILRKPYAFLIKYFGLIHIIMFVLLTYLIFLLRPIKIFFSDYISNNSNMYFENMASKYIPSVLFIVVIVIMVLSFGIFFLMKKKEKPVLFYRFVIIYSIILFIAAIYFYFFFKSLSTTNYNNLRIVINRDVSVVLYYLDYLLVAFSFIRAFGFDIKKFSFEKDRRELQLEAGDREEYEININVEKEDIIDYLNRQKREFKYYFKENSKFFIVVSIIIILSLTLYFSYNHFIKNPLYNEKQDIIINNLIYNVNQSIITTHDKYGKIIDDENEYLVVYLNIDNNGKKITFNDQQLRINIEKEYYYPIVNRCSSFSDLGLCYDTNINTGKQDYIVVFRIPKKHSKIFFEILKNKNGYQYSRVNLSYKNDYREIINYNMKDIININNDNYQVNSYQLLNKTSYIYESCINNNCSSYTKIVKGKLDNRVLVVEIENQDKLSDDFLDNYIGLKYNKNILYGSDIEVIDRYKNMIYLGVPSYVRDDDLILTINMRYKEYDVLLKEGANE